MEELTTQIGPIGAALVGLVAAVVQQFKRFPSVVAWQKKLPIYQLLSLAAGIAGAHMFGLVNPVFAGVMVGLSAMGSFDAVKTVELPKVDLSTIAKTIVPILLILFLCVGCSSPAKVQPVAWLLSGANVQSLNSENEIEETVEYIGRAGIQIDPNDSSPIEFGLASDWWMGSPRQSYGVYAVQFLSQDPNSLMNMVYVGGQATLDLEEDGGMYGFVTGKILNIGGLQAVTEFTARTYNDVLETQMPNSADRYKAYVGLRIPFPISK